MKGLKRESDFYKLPKLKYLTEKALEKFDIIPQQWFSRHIDNGNDTVESTDFQHCDLNEYIKLINVNFKHDVSFSCSKFYTQHGVFFQ